MPRTKSKDYMSGYGQAMADVRAELDKMARLIDRSLGDAPPDIEIELRARWLAMRHLSAFIKGFKERKLREWRS